MTETAFTRLHPYPAMAADELVQEIDRRYSINSGRMLDPFCGSGRLLAATSHRDVERVGFDVNPLACLLTRSKLVAGDASSFVALASDLGATSRFSPDKIEILEGRVEWFSEQTLEELAGLISWVNSRDLEEADRLLCASALSATARACSFARKSGWKLHRMKASDRLSHRFDSKSYFQKKLSYIARELSRRRPLLGNTSVLNVSAQAGMTGAMGRFDRIITSPPYGDSRTTVQYGAASELCLAVIRHIRGLEGFYAKGALIDRNCLGGAVAKGICIDGAVWAGADDNPRRASVEAFLSDYGQVCDQVSASLASAGIAVFVVGCRTVGGHLLDLEKFTRLSMERTGLRLVDSFTRPLKGKSLPSSVNRFARSADEATRSAGRAPTMQAEQILAFR